MFVIENGDKIQGDASAATVVDYHISGLQGTTLKNLADGQLAATIGDLYTSAGTDVAKTIVLVNTDSSARTVNLYHTPSGGTARRIIPKDTSLGAGCSLRLEGNMMQVLNTEGAVLTTVGAISGDSVTTGTLIHEVGGLEADVSAYDGLVKISGGATSAITAPSGTIVGTTDTQTLTNKTIQTYGITGSAAGNVGATETFDCTVANYFTATLDQASTFTFSNPPSSGNAGGFRLVLTNGGAFTITWPASVDWAGGTAPTLTASGVDILDFTTSNAGTTWYGVVVATDIK